MKRQAFTLIEVMVVLSILAIIAILAYNFFGGTMREAALKSGVIEIKNTLELMSKGYESYYRANGAYPTNTIDESLNQITNTLVPGGHVRSIPKPPIEAWSGYSSIRYRAWPQYDLNGDGTNDTYMILSEVNDEYCQMFNDMFANGVSRIIAVPGDISMAPATNRDMICGSSGGARNIIWYFMNYN